MPKVKSEHDDNVLANDANDEETITKSENGNNDDTGDAGGDEKEDMREELAAMIQRVKEMEEEQSKIQQMQSQLEKDLSGVDEAKEDVDARSVYVGNVDYEASPEELQTHFQDCGPVNRVTILTDKFGNPKGFAYIEFTEKEAVDQAVLLDESAFRGRTLKVLPKRTNVPGMAIRGRGRGRGGFRGGPPRGGAFRGGYRGGYRGAPRGRGGAFRGGRGGYHPYTQ